MEKYVIDTNCLVGTFSRKNEFYVIWEKFFAGKFVLCVSNEILSEYEEILAQKHGSEVASNVIKAILYNSNVEKVDVHYHFNLIVSDPDDNKFVDCAIAANARLIVTNDHHFDVLNTIPFPHVEVANIVSFVNLLSSF